MLTNKHGAGFTLVEIAIVLAIIALLVGGLLVPLSVQIDQQNIEDTRKSLGEITDALVGYAVIHGRLPCPADGTTRTGGTNAAGVGAGQEYKNPATGSPYVCANAVGVLPWVTLGVDETDAWGRRYTYQVTPTWADSTDGTAEAGCNVASGVSFQICSSGNLNILSTVGGTSVASNMPAVVVSHGKNGFGAYLPNGSRMRASSDADEAENSNDDANYVSRTTTATFDDIVTWISPNILMNRMIQAEKLP